MPDSEVGRDAAATGGGVGTGSDAARSRGRFRGRWLKVLLVAALLAGGALAIVLYPRVAMRIELRPETVQLDGYALSVRDTGEGRPAVVIEAGLACTKEGYDRLHYDLSDVTRVISYDHAGIGHSTPNRSPRTLPHYVEELRALLAKKQVAPPYILVGHSLGGHIVRYYAHLHPDEVAGLVFIDHPHEDWFDYIRKTWPKAEQERYFEWWTPEGSSYTGTALEELLVYEDNCDLLRGVALPPDIPVLMFTGSNDPHFQPGQKARDRKAWRDYQASLLRGVKTKRHIVDWETGHWPHLDKPELFAREIGQFVREVRAEGEAAGKVAGGAASP